MIHPPIKTISMHVHSFSLRFRLRYDPAFTVFDYIDFADAQGFTGVNISANGPGYRDLGGTTEDHFAAVRDHLQARSMPCEIDTSDTRPKNMTRMLHVAAALGADRLRTYTKYTGTLPDLIRWTIADLRAIAPLAEDLGIVVVLENHEDFQGKVIGDILAAVDHPNIRALYDYGNSQMVGEDPLVALAAMLPFTTTIHLKDHIIASDGASTFVQGVPTGTGRLPIIEQTDRLYDGGLRRFCFENVWAYVAPLLVDPSELPKTPPFEVKAVAGRLNGNDLDLADAINAEAEAFRSGWDWLQHALSKNGYVIARE